MVRVFGRLAASVIALSIAAPGVAIAASGDQASAGPAITVPPIDFTERKLANGLRVIAIRDTTTPNVTVQMWYDVGSKHDPEGRSGFAHLFEHILSRKTVNMPYNMINRLTENVGGQRNASVWFDRTNYYEIVPAQYLETMLWTHAERMARPVVDADVFETERNVVKEEYRQRVLAPPYGRLRLVMDENSYDTMPHRRPGIGSLAQLDAATLEDARAFHEAYYGPDTATLIVAGNFDPTQLDAMVNRYFAEIPARKNAIPLAITATEAPRTSPRAVTAYAPNVSLPLIATSWRIPGASHPDLPALTVMDAILSEGDNSRLRQALVFKSQIATSAGAQLSDTEDGGYYAPQVTLASGRSVEEAETALAREIARMRDEPVTAAELAEAKNEILASALAARETFSSRAFSIGEALVRTGDPRSLDARLAAVSRVTAADIQRVARTYLKPEARVDIRYLDESLRPSGQADAWANPVPMPRWASVPPATRAPLALAAEGDRQPPPEPSAPVPVTPPTLAEARLANGITLVSARTGQVPIATLALVFPGGAATDPDGRAGLSSLAADLATRGTATRSAQQIAADMEALGASLSTSAGADGTTLSVTAPVATLEPAARILADLARNATFPQAEFDRERRQTIDRLQVAMRNPGTLANFALQPVSFGSAPYGRVPTPASLEAMTRADLIAQRDRWWRPDLATMVVTGGIDAAQARAIGERAFADWRADGPAPAVPTARAGATPTPRVVVIDMPGAGQAAVTAALRVPDRADPAYYDLLVANAVLGSGSNGRLFQEVRVKRALSYGASSSLGARAESGLITAAAQTKNESAADVVAIFRTELDRLATEPLDAETVEQRKAFLIGSVSRTAENSRGFASTIAGLVQQGVAPAEAARVVERISAVTPESATAAARANVAANRASIVVVGDAKLFVDALRSAHPDLELVQVDALALDRPTLLAE